MKQTKDIDYQKTKAELDEILVWFERSDVSVDDAFIKYKKAEQLLEQLDAYLNDTKTKIDQIIKKSTKS